nr:DUF4276 family protein [uncultured Fluviicola sp.]
MKRIIIICEGETEREFCLTMLAPHFVELNIHIQPPLIKKSMGGVVNWKYIKEQIEQHLKHDRSAYVTTLIDYYGLYKKHSFPRWEEIERVQDKNQRMDEMERAMFEDINEELRPRYIPYIQLHEFEGLLFNEKQIFHDVIPKNELIGLPELEQVFRDYSNPEMINNTRHTSPSHRLMRIIDGYDKIVYGNIIAEIIGLEKIRSKSPRFNAWISTRR